MGILSKVFNGIPKAIEGLFDVRAPVLPVQAVLKVLPSRGCRQMGSGSRKGKPAAAEKRIKQGKEFPPELVP